MARILFPDPFVASLVAAARALGRRGDTCDVAWAYGPLKKYFKSRFVRRVHPTANLSADPEGFAKDVLRLCESGAYDFLMPLSLESTEALLPHKNELASHVATLLPTKEQLSIGADKVQTIRLCRRLRIAHPKTLFVRERKELDQFAETTDYPAVIKLARNLGGSRGVRIAGNAEELQIAFEELRTRNTLDSPLLAQEFVPGLLFDAVAVARGGTCPRIFTSVRKLMYPITGGITCIGVSTRSPELKQIAASIIADLKWTGPIDLEFMLDTRDSKFKLIEINPRFWGGLGASVKCGLNFPAIAVDLALGRAVESSLEHEVGVCHKFMISRVPYAYWQLVRAKGLKAIRDPQRYNRITYDMDLGDPMPDVFAFMLMTRGLLKGKFSNPLTDDQKSTVHGFETPVPYT